MKKNDLLKLFWSNDHYFNMNINDGRIFGGRNVNIKLHNCSIHTPSSQPDNSPFTTIFLSAPNIIITSIVQNKMGQIGVMKMTTDGLKGYSEPSVVITNNLNNDIKYGTYFELFLGDYTKRNHDLMTCPKCQTKYNIKIKDIISLPWPQREKRIKIGELHKCSCGEKRAIYTSIINNE